MSAVNDNLLFHSLRYSTPAALWALSLVLRTLQGMEQNKILPCHGAGPHLHRASKMMISSRQSACWKLVGAEKKIKHNRRGRGWGDFVKESLGETSWRKEQMGPSVQRSWGRSSQKESATGWGRYRERSGSSQRGQPCRSLGTASRWDMGPSGVGQSNITVCSGRDHQDWTWQ